jgi:peptidoglycan/xylan/chitin deacetylase (PgdA/CDA1 family)
MGLLLGAGLAGAAFALEGQVGVALGLVVLLAGLVVLASSQPGVGCFGATILRVSECQGIVLSIDDGPHPATTPLFLQALKKNNARATFFVLGDRVAAWPELFWAIVEDGHEVALHGPVHSAHHTWKSPKRSALELRQAAAYLQSLGAPPIRWYRPPFGAVSPRLYQAVQQAGLSLVWCSVRTGDGVRVTEARLKQRLSRARPGDIVLIHDGNPITAQLLPEYLAQWQQQGVAVIALGDAR